MNALSVDQELDAMATFLAQLSSEVELYKALGGGWTNTENAAAQD